MTEEGRGAKFSRQCTEPGRFPTASELSVVARSPSRSNTLLNVDSVFEGLCSSHPTSRLLVFEHHLIAVGCSEESTGHMSFVATAIDHDNDVSICTRPLCYKGHLYGAGSSQTDSGQMERHRGSERPRVGFRVLAPRGKNLECAEMVHALIRDGADATDLRANTQSVGSSTAL
jgi:hypothetical protein